MESTQLVEADASGVPMTLSDVKAQINLIQEILRYAMKRGIHYDVIPGCGDKPSLLKPGAEKLNMTFRMAPKPEVETIDLGNGHREYRVSTSLYTIHSQVFLGTGVGVCSTMETKWRYRTQNTGNEVPKAYWKSRDKELLGGEQYSPRKVDNKWMIFEKIEHDNPADYWNTCLKMGKKRSLVDGVLTVTAASDLFTQDVEEMGDTIGAGTQKKTESSESSESSEKKEPVSEPEKKSGRVISEPQRKRMYAIAKSNGWTDEYFKDYLVDIVGVKSSKDVLRDNYEEICNYIATHNSDGNQV